MSWAESARAEEREMASPSFRALRSLSLESRHSVRARLFSPARKTTPDWHSVYLFCRSVGLISCRSEHPKTFRKRLHREAHCSSHGTLGQPFCCGKRGCVDD